MKELAGDVVQNNRAKLQEARQSITFSRVTKHVFMQSRKNQALDTRVLASDMDETNKEKLE